jgi:hypothetical protein
MGMIGVVDADPRALAARAAERLLSRRAEQRLTLHQPHVPGRSIEAYAIPHADLAPAVHHQDRIHPHGGVVGVQMFGGKGTSSHQPRQPSKLQKPLTAPRRSRRVLWSGRRPRRRQTFVI